MPLDMTAVKRNKWMVAGAGGVGLVVLYALYKRRQSSAAASGSGTAATSTGTVSGPLAGVDTTGTDMAGWLSQFGQQQQTQLDQFQTAISQQLATLGQAPTRPSVPTPAPPPPASKPPASKPPATHPTSSPASQYVTVARYTSRNAPWNSTLSGIAGHYHTSVSALMKLNPSIRNANRINTGQRIRVS